MCRHSKCWTQSGRSGAPIDIENDDARESTLVVPKNAFAWGTVHVILAVTDSGTPPLTRYRRVIINVAP